MRAVVKRVSKTTIPVSDQYYSVTFYWENQDKQAYYEAPGNLPLGAVFWLIFDRPPPQAANPMWWKSVASYSW